MQAWFVSLSISFVSNINLQLTHPFCTHCAQDTTTALEKRLEAVRKEYEAYQTFVSASSTVETKNAVDLDDSIETNLKVLADLQLESESTRAQIAHVQSQLNELVENEEAEHWTQFNAASLAAAETSTKIAAQKAQTIYKQSRLDELEKASVIDDVFKIFYDGQYATINGIPYSNTFNN